MKKLKNITINGIPNKTKQRTICKDWNLMFDIDSHTEQISNINQLYINGNCSNKDIFISQLNQKLSSYKQQDIKKLRLNKEKFMDMDTLTQLLVESKLRCNYCRNCVYILYNKSFDKKQWTLDRINNGIGHNKDNCVISCLKCNVQRRVMDDEKFKFTKQMKIKKIDTVECEDVENNNHNHNNTTPKSKRSIQVTNTRNFNIIKKNNS